MSDLDAFIAHTMEGIGYGLVADLAIDTLRDGLIDHPVKDDRVYAAAKARVERLRPFAEAEAEEGYPYLTSLVIVRLWSIMEAAVGALLADAVASPGPAADEQTLSRVKGSLFEFARGSEDERIEALVQGVLNTMPESAKIGVGRFEIPLASLGFGGAVDPAVARGVLELSEVRNAVVHGGGAVGKRLAERCPWLGWESTTQLAPTQRDYRIYTTAAYWYLLELERRWRDVRGRAPLEEYAQLQGQMLDRLTAMLQRRDAGPSGESSDG